MKRVLTALLCLAMLLCACGQSESLPQSTSAATEPQTLLCDLPAVMEPLQGGPMLYTFTGRNGKLGLINQDGNLVAAPQYEPPNGWDYSAEFSLDVRYSYDADGRINGITLQKGARGEEFIHYTLDGKSRPADGFPAGEKPAISSLYSIHDEGSGTIYGADQTPLYTTRPGEEIIALYAVPYTLPVIGLAVQTAEGRIIKAFDHQGAPMQTTNKAQFFTDKYTKSLFKLQKGNWTVLSLRQFINPDNEFHDAAASLVTEDWVIVATGESYESLEVEELFPVDWDGAPVEDCPLAPYLTTDWITTAGEQGPHYLWVETADQRGYIDLQGNWLFIDETGL